MAHPVRRLLRPGLSLALSGLAVAALLALASATAVGAPPRDAAAPAWPPAAIAWPLALEAAGDLQAAHAALDPHLAASQAASLTLSVGAHNGRVSGNAPRAAALTLVLWRGAEAVAQAAATPVLAPGGGYLFAATLVSRYGNFAPLRAGDVLAATQAGETVSLTVPLLTAWADGASATVFGQAPPDAPLVIVAYRYGDLAWAGEAAATAGPDGRYTAALPAAAPRDYGYVFSADPAGNYIYLRYNVPYLQLDLSGKPRLSGMAAPSVPLSITLRPAVPALGGDGGQQWWTQAPGTEGNFDASGFPLNPGDTLVITAGLQVFTLTAPQFSAAADAVADAVTGQAPAGGAARVELFGIGNGSYCSAGLPSSAPREVITVSVAADGRYMASFAGRADLKAGFHGTVWIADAAGQVFTRRFAVPFLYVRLGSGVLQGQLSEFLSTASWGPGRALTITVTGASGAARDTHQITSAAYDDCFYDGGYAYGYGAGADGSGGGGGGGGSGMKLQPGDRVALTSQTGQSLSLTLPALSARLNWADGRVEGRAPAGSVLWVGVNAAGKPPTEKPLPVVTAAPAPPVRPGAAGSAGDATDRPVLFSYSTMLPITATADGRFTANLAELATLRPGVTGGVLYTDGAGHQVELSFRAPYLSVTVGGNQVTGVAPGGATSGQLTVRRADGNLKASVPIKVSSYDSSFYTSLYPCAAACPVIAAGDQVEVWAGGERLTMSVPTLTLGADLAADVILGQAPPGAALQVNWYGRDGWGRSLQATWPITATAAGAYSLNVAGVADLRRSDSLGLVFTDGSSNQAWLTTRVPGVWAGLGENRVSLLGNLRSPYTLRLLDVDGAGVYSATGQLNDGGFAELWLSDRSGPIRLAAGQTLQADIGGDLMHLTVPHLTAVADPASQTIAGQAPAGARLAVYLGASGYSGITATASASGVYTVDMTRVGISPASWGTVTYLQPDGNGVRIAFATLSLALTMDGWEVRGQALPSRAVDATLRDRAGQIKAMGKTGASQSGYYTLYLLDAAGRVSRIQAGDELTVTDGQSVMRYTVPELSAALNRRTSILRGQAPAGAWLTVRLGNYTRQVQADATGAYAMDWSDVAPQGGAAGSITASDNRGISVTTYFIAPYDKVYLPAVIRTR